jgi:hypothetical protein
MDDKDRNRMNDDAKAAAGLAAARLSKLLEFAERDTAESLQENDIPTAVRHFHQLRDAVRDLQELTTLLQNHVDMVSQQLLPTLFLNQGVKSIRVEDVGAVTIADRWSASMISRETGMQWLRDTGNGGLIIETVNAATLGAFAKDMAQHGAKLPDDIFKVTPTPYTSIRQS